VGCASWTSAPVSETVSVDLIVQGELRPGDGSSVAVVVNDGQIVDVVSLDAVGERFTSARTLEAAVITAGFVDAHAHPYGLGRLDSQLVLTGINTYAATLTAVDSAPGTAWIVGRGWDQNDWSDAPEGSWPLATDLDAHSAGRPAAIRRVDGHAVWLNTAALTASGVTKDTPDPDGGRIVRDASGAPTGVLVDEAMSLVHTPDDAPADRLVWTARAFELMAEVGLTGAHAMGLSDESLAVFTALAESGEMPVRIWAYVEPESEAAERLMATGPWSVGHLEVVGVKAFADGALGSRGAWLTDAYADEPGHFGTPIHAPADIQQWATALHATGASMAVHSIGDRAVHHTVQSFVAAHSEHPESSATLRVEHAQLLPPEDRVLMAEHGFIASMQPTHATSDMPWAEDRVGAERLAWAYTWRTVLDVGIPLAFGSDFPVESHRPALGLWSATHRTDLSGQPAGGWTPDERVSEDEAITAFTRGSAVAVGNDVLGIVRSGAPADLTLWSPSTDAPWTPVGTVVNGQVIFDATSGVESE
jgi:predicted amidohydrolase YtcJ